MKSDKEWEARARELAEHVRTTTGETVKVSVEEVVVRFTPETEAAIRADEREHCADKLEAWGYITAAAIVREVPKPKTREQALEEALRQADASLARFGSHEHSEPRYKIAKALEWHP